MGGRFGLLTEEVESNGIYISKVFRDEKEAYGTYKLYALTKRAWDT